MNKTLSKQTEKTNVWSVAHSRTILIGKYVDFKGVKINFLHFNLGERPLTKDNGMAPCCLQASGLRLASKSGLRLLASGGKAIMKS